jgi:tetraacyldisaccharide 4'-kinase
MKKERIKIWYLNFLEKKRLNLAEKLLWVFLYILSLVYGLLVWIKNTLYDLRLKKVYHSLKKIICVGNLSWAGSGKTSLVISLHKELSPKYKTALLRRGYGQDENKLLAEITSDLYCSPNRVGLVKKLEKDFDLFIIDDCFQYRKIARNVNIVVMGAREFKTGFNLIPASFFREPLRSLKRADIVLLTYLNELDNPKEIRSLIKDKFSHLDIFEADYIVKSITNIDNKPAEIQKIKEKPIAALTAIGYPKGFLNTLRKEGFNVVEEFIFSDHYELTLEDYEAIETKLISKEIRNLIITPKDKFRVPVTHPRVNIYVLNVELAVYKKELFLKEIEKKLQ